MLPHAYSNCLLPLQCSMRETAGAGWRRSLFGQNCSTWLFQISAPKTEKERQTCRASFDLFTPQKNPSIFCFKPPSPPQLWCSSKKSVSPGFEAEGLPSWLRSLPESWEQIVQSSLITVSLQHCHTWDVPKKYKPLSRCNVESPLVDKASAGSLLRLLMDLLLSAQQKTGQLSAPLSSARLLPFPAWTAKRKITMLPVSRASSYTESTIFLHRPHKNLIHQLKFTAMLMERQR